MFIIFKLLNVQKSIIFLPLLFNAAFLFVPTMLVTIISCSGIYVPYQHYLIIFVHFIHSLL